MAATVKVYTTSHCPFCVRAKNLLGELEIPFEEINMDGKPDEMLALKDKTGLRTVPQIFINEELVGGFTELSALNESGELKSKCQ